MDAITTTPAQTVSTRSQTSSEQTGASSDYETFLKMLTVQMQNQDPLNPVESSDFAAQLATFSSVEQQVLTNDLLTSIKARLSDSDFASMANWVGMEVRSLNPVYVDRGSVTVPFEQLMGGDRTEFFVLDQDGAEIYRAGVSPGQTSVVWDGISGSGERVNPGLYSIHAESFESGESLGQKRLETYGLIKEAQIAADGLRLVLEGGVEIAPDDVTALRAPV